MKRYEKVLLIPNTTPPLQITALVKPNIKDVIVTEINGIEIRITNANNHPIKTQQNTNKAHIQK